MLEPCRFGWYVGRLLLKRNLLQIQQGDSKGWRFHLEGIQNLIRLRGGIRAVAEVKGLEALLHCVLL